MYKANLSGEQNSFYLQELLQNKLIIQGQADDGSLMYRTTQRGREYLGHYYQMMGLMELVQDNGNDILATDLSGENLLLSSRV